MLAEIMTDIWWFISIMIILSSLVLINLGLWELCIVLREICDAIKNKENPK
jgi:hypothetical protein